MLEALHHIRSFNNGDKSILKDEKWLMYLGLTRERNINFERVYSLKEIENNYVLDYVQKTLECLEELNLKDKDVIEILQEVLKWSEVAKAGLRHQRDKWINKGYNLFAHNEGSAKIYLESVEIKQSKKCQIIHTLILTHGLIGQFIRGEVSLVENKPLYELIERDIVSKEMLGQLIFLLNYCIISAVDKKLWARIEKEVKEITDYIVQGAFNKQLSVKERLRRLRKTSISNGENFDLEYQKFQDDESKAALEKLFDHFQLWYVESALYDFTFEEFIKILLLSYYSVDCNSVKHISFERLMKTIYYEHDGRKRINIYKKRIIEKYLGSMDIKDIINKVLLDNKHVVYKINTYNLVDNIVFFEFAFSKPSEKLIDFCMEAEKADVLYEKAIILLFDLFDLRKDQYDRFYEEETYLQTMNQTIDYKKIILKYIIGNKVVDIGPGGGALMDLIETSYPDKEILGVDIAQNVLDALKKKKNVEAKKWDVLYGDALNLKEYIPENSIDTIIFCSILHELFSYIPFNGKKFNHETLRETLKSAFEVLKPGGRIIIRDGIMTEPQNQKRIIKFLSEEGMYWLKRFKEDFKGREIHYTVVGQNEVCMLINDAMEFLYTYTWGEKSYAYEIHEQFGYFTPTQFKAFIADVLGDQTKVIECQHFLQEGYTIALSQKITFLDENRKNVRLPDSTCLIVIEKQA